jgi:hypothetical protein
LKFFSTPSESISIGGSSGISNSFLYLVDTVAQISLFVEKINGAVKSCVEEWVGLASFEIGNGDSDTMLTLVRKTFVNLEGRKRLTKGQEALHTVKVYQLADHNVKVGHSY